MPFKNLNITIYRRGVDIGLACAKATVQIRSVSSKAASGKSIFPPITSDWRCQTVV